jgi:hypothetical protein
MIRAFEHFFQVFFSLSSQFPKLVQLLKSHKSFKMPIDLEYIRRRQRRFEDLPKGKQKGKLKYPARGVLRD